MDKNQLYKSFLFVLSLVVLFGLLSLIHYDRLNLGFDIKPVSFFSDVLKDEEPQVPIEVKKIVEQQKKEDAYPSGMVGFENFSGEDEPLAAFFDKLSSARNGAKVRVAWFGDSFTDADLVVGDLRDTLQSVYGGNGVGFVPMTSEAPGFRRTVMHEFGNWETRSVIRPAGNRNYGINGHAYYPDSANYVRFAGSRSFLHTRSFDEFHLFYEARNNSEVRVVLNDTVKQTLELNESTTPEMLTVENPGTRKVRFRFPRTSGLVVYGASLESEEGVYIDNFSIKGNSGLSLLAIPTDNLARFDSLLHYDLVVLQFGLNAVDAQTKDFTGYLQGIGKLVKKIRTAFPSTPILMLSVSDRSERVQGEYVTMKSIKGLVAAQEKFAYDHQLVFWNLYQAMGGENSMARFVSAQPALANKDYTHLNFKGGKKIGLTLARTLIYEQKKYHERKKPYAAN